jgi:hypothetical protein
VSIRFQKLRFNLDKERDREAWDILQSVPGSRNAYILDAVCAYANQLTQEEACAAFQQQILGVIRAGLSVQPVNSQPQSVAPVNEDDTVLDNFLESAF